MIVPDNPPAKKREPFILTKEVLGWLVAIILGTVATLNWFDGRYANKEVVEKTLTSIQESVKSLDSKVDNLLERRSTNVASEDRVVPQDRLRPAGLRGEGSGDSGSSDQGD